MRDIGCLWGSVSLLAFSNNADLTRFSGIFRGEKTIKKPIPIDRLYKITGGSGGT